MLNELTPQESIRELSRILPYTAGVSDVDRRDRAIAAAKDALKKQIPTKPDLKPKPLKNEVFWWQCPICKAHTHANTKHKYCHFCGQALDWN